MRGTTMVWMGVRHVGDSKWVTQPEEVCVRDVTRKLAEVLISVSLATRIELVIARTSDEVSARLMDGRSTKAGSGLDVTQDEWDDLERQALALADELQPD